MNADKQDEKFIKEVCLILVQKAKTYDEAVEMLTAYVDHYGTVNNLSLCEMDRIQNEVYRLMDF